MTINRSRAFTLGAMLGIAAVIVTGLYLKARNKVTERRDYFSIVASSLYNYNLSNKKLVTDECLHPQDTVTARPNSWRIKLIPFIDNGGIPWDKPWFSPDMATWRGRQVPIYNRPGNLFPIVNAVRPGGPGAQPVGGWESPKDRKRLLIVESYPEESCWYEGSDLDLITLLKTKAVSEALQLDKAQRASFLAIFSDFSCVEIKAAIPKKYVEAWIEGRAISEAESREAASFIIWSKSVL